MEALTRSATPLELNNCAVSLLQAGCAVEAMELLQLSLSRLRDSYIGSPALDKDRNQVAHVHTVCENCIPSPVPQPMTPNNTIQVLGSEVMRCGDVPETSFLALYDRALLVDRASKHDGDDDDSLLSAIVLFNMALLHHLRADGSGQAGNLERAGRLYKLALDVIREDRYNYPEGSTRLIQLALYNNLAHIDAQLFRMDAMMVSLDRIRELLSEMKEQLDDDDYMELEEEDFIVFSMNAMFGTRNEFSVAAAA